jgi:hypothetical protein
MIKKIFGSAVCILFLSLIAVQAHAQRRDIEVCHIFGSVYFEPNKAYADIVVFEEDSEAFAHLPVFKTDNRLFADRSGLWHVVKDPNQARFRVHITKNKALADFTIYYMDTESFAGCR